MRPKFPAARLIDALPAGDLAKPERQVWSRPDVRPVYVQLQEHILRQLLGQGSIAQKMIRQAEHHGLVIAYGRVEIEEPQLLPYRLLSQTSRSAPPFRRLIRTKGSTECDYLARQGGYSGNGQNAPAEKPSASIPKA